MYGRFQLWKRLTAKPDFVGTHGLVNDGRGEEERTEETLVNFLRRRGCQEGVVKRLKDENIDCKVLLLMSEEKVKEYIPSYGDQVAAVAFATSQQQTHGFNKEDEVMKRLKRKLLKTDHMMGNKHARKNDIRIDIGWWDFDKASQSYKQVRIQNGGGKRSLKVPKETTKHELIEIGQQLFFPNGVSKKGGIENFHFELKDFSTNEDIVTVDDVLRVTKFKAPLNIYLYTTSTQEVNTFKQGDSVENDVNPTYEPMDLQFQYGSMPAPDDVEIDTCPPTGFEFANDDLANTSSTNEVNFVGTGTPTVSFRASALQEQKTTVQPEEQGASVGHQEKATSVWPMQDTAIESVDSYDDVECIEVPRRRNRRSLSLRRSPTTTATCSTSENSEIEEAIKRSLEDAESKTTFEGVLSSWIRKNLKQDEHETILIHRGRILKSANWAIQKPNFSFEKTVAVTFSGEIGADSGGPKREFFRELMKEVEGEITVGMESNKVLKHDATKLHNKAFQKAGHLIAWSILQGGPGFPVLNGSLYDLMIGERDCSIDLDVVDLETKNVIEAVQNASTEDGLQTVLKEHFDWFVDRGLVMYGKRLENKLEMTKVIFKNAVYYRTHAEITQLQHGLEDIGKLHSLIMEHPRLMKRLLVQSENLSFKSFRELYSITFSEKGSNKRSAEEDAIFCFETFLMETEAGRTGVTLENILQFWTGAARQPPLGFPHKPEITFVDSVAARLPVARTCGMVLELCRSFTDPAEFSDSMEKAIKWSGGFHLA